MTGMGSCFQTKAGRWARFSGRSSFFNSEAVPDWDFREPSDIEAKLAISSPAQKPLPLPDRTTADTSSALARDSPASMMASNMS